MANFVHMVKLYGDSSALVCMCEKHQAEAEADGWCEMNPEHFLADFCQKRELCERCEEKDETAAGNG